MPTLWNKRLPTFSLRRHNYNLHNARVAGCWEEDVWPLGDGPVGVGHCSCTLSIFTYQSSLLNWIQDWMSILTSISAGYLSLYPRSVFQNHQPSLRFSGVTETAYSRHILVLVLHIIIGFLPRFLLHKQLAKWSCSVISSNHHN